MTKQIAVKLPDKLVDELDRLVQGGAFDSRSQAIRTGIEAMVAQQHRQEIDQRFRDGAARLPETIEDIDEAVYRVDRMLTHLRLSGRLSSLRGVLIGKLKGCGGEAEMHALLEQFFGSNHIPVVRDLPVGHHGNNLLMPIGAPVQISTSSRSLTITQSAVQR